MTQFQLTKRNLSKFICFSFLFIGLSISSFSQTKGTPSQKELLNKKNKLNDDIKQLN